MSAEQDPSRGPKGARGEVRDRLLESAKILFGSQDFQSTTVRQIAERADCDPGLVSYYFGSKIGLFREAMSLPADPIKVIFDAFEGGPGAGQRIMLAVMNLWESSEATSNFRMFMSTTVASRATFEVFASWLDESFLTPLAAQIDGPDAKLRVQLAFSQVLGTVVARYVYGSDPLAGESKEKIAAIIGEHIDALLGTTVP
ncbi:MAG: TetR family transcriptional regulator [Actinomycetaceae bacterium]|nr:TetR family transcriptional regulator [Actinomycetaceae bacterium]